MLDGIENVSGDGQGQALSQGSIKPEECNLRLLSDLNKIRGSVFTVN